VVGDGVGAVKSKIIFFPSYAVSGPDLCNDPSSLGRNTAVTPKITLITTTAGENIVFVRVYIVGAIHAIILL
jgi:hypothetical protein